MHRAERKSAGALPFGSLIYRIFEHFKIPIVDRLKDKPTLVVPISSNTLYKMQLESTNDGCVSKRTGEVVHFRGGEELEEICLALLRNKLKEKAEQKKRKKPAPNTVPRRQESTVVVEQEEVQEEEGHQPLRRKCKTRASAHVSAQEKSSTTAMSRASSDVEVLEIQENLRPLQTIVPPHLQKGKEPEEEEENEDEEAVEDEIEEDEEDDEEASSDSSKEILLEEEIAEDDEEISTASGEEQEDDRDLEEIADFLQSYRSQGDEDVQEEESTLEDSTEHTSEDSSDADTPTSVERDGADQELVATAAAIENIVQEQQEQEEEERREEKEEENQEVLEEEELGRHAVIISEDEMRGICLPLLVQPLKTMIAGPCQQKINLWRKILSISTI